MTDVRIEGRILDADARQVELATGVELARRFAGMIEQSDYPCVGAKSAIARDQITAYIGRDIQSSWDDLLLVRELITFAQTYKTEQSLFITFAAFFPDTPPMSEQCFERALWERVDSLQAKDEWLGQRPDPSVSTDPSNPHFSLSFGGQSFFIVGLHQNASRPARRFECPVLIFNLHDQFERLRADGRYEKLRETILVRDEQLSGSRNPMVARHGESSEARQYAGRIVGPDWECPWSGRESERKPVE